MGQYERPHIEPRVFRDEAGIAVDYGDRWAEFGGAPPVDSCSVVDHPERFAPLHAVATALIGHLASTYDVNLDEGRDVTAGLPQRPPSDETVRAVRLTPRSGASAPLVIVLTDFPGVFLYAGVLFSAVYPSCGCSACDERWDDLADELEWHTFAIVGGGLTEEVSPPPRPKRSRISGQAAAASTVSHRLRSVDGDHEQSGRISGEEVPPALLTSAREQLDDLAMVSPRQLAAVGAAGSAPRRRTAGRRRMTQENPRDSKLRGGSVPPIGVDPMTFRFSVERSTN